MGRIKIEDLPQDTQIGEDQLRRIRGGVEPTSFPIKGILGFNKRLTFSNPWLNTKTLDAIGGYIQNASSGDDFM